MNKKHKKQLNSALLLSASITLLVLSTDPRWQVKLNCISVLLVIVAIELGFAVEAQCRVFKPGMKRPCERRTWGVLLGCYDHRATKLLAWVRYLGSGRLMARLNISRARIVGGTTDPQPNTAPTSAESAPAVQTILRPPVEAAGENTTRENIEFLCVLVSAIASVISTIVALVVA